MGNTTEIRQNEAESRFETLDGAAYMQYGDYKGNLALMKTFVPEEKRGQGIASALAAFAFQYAKEKELPIMMYCPFVSAYVKQHPELRQQLSKEYHR